MARPTLTSPTSISVAVKAIYRDGGVRGFWRGNGANLVKIVPEMGVRFGAYDVAKSIIAADPANVGAAERFIAGAIGGIVATLAVYPLEIAKTRIALSARGQYRSVLHCLKSIWVREGPRSMYRGMGASLLGIIPYSGTELMTFSLLRDAYTRRYPHREPGVPTLLLSGAAASLAGQLVAYPLQLVRTRLQAQGMEGRPILYHGIVDCFRRTVRDEGLRGLYRGIVPGFMKSIPSCMIAFTVYDRSKTFFKSFLPATSTDSA